MSKTSPRPTKASRDSLFDRLKDARVRLFSSAGFQKFCAGFLPTRFVARAKAAEVFDLCAGFVYSQILFTCVKTNLLEALRECSRDLDEISDLTGLQRAGAERLVLGAVSLHILEARSGGRYGLGEIGASVVGSPGLQGMILHHEYLYRDLSDPVGLLSERTKSTALANYWLYSAATDGSDTDRETMATYSDLMSRSQDVLAAELLRAYPVQGHKHLMDVGGGEGRFLCHAHAAAPELKLSLFDLPTVAALAREKLQADGIAVSVQGGNMFEDAWPEGADLISLIRVCLDHDDDKVETLLARAREALPPGGVLLLAEPMTDSPKVGHAYFGLYLWAMGSGRARSSEELRQMLERAGFSETSVINTGLPDLIRVIRAS